MDNYLFLYMKDVRPAKEWMIISGMLVIVLVTGVFGASDVSEFPICTEGCGQWYPETYGNVIINVNIGS